MIKFRAWDKHDNSWVNYPVFIGSDGEVYWEHYERGLQEDSGLVISQSTGLKDKNGKEIFEGDIVKVIDLNYRIEVISEVVWGMNSNVYGNYPAFAIQDFESESNSFSEIFDSGCYRIKVIGNIYENPELLEVRNASK